MVNTKITELEGKMPDGSSLVTKFVLTVVENKIPDVSSLVKETDYNTQISETENKVNNHNHDKYITTPEFNTMAADVFKPRLGMLGLTAAASATDAAVNKKKILGSGNHTTLITSNEDMQDLLKIVKSLEDSGILLAGIAEIVKNEVKEQKGGFLSMLLGTLGASLLGDLLTKNLSDRGVIRAGEGTIRAGCGSIKKKI